MFTICVNVKYGISRASLQIGPMPWIHPCWWTVRDDQSFVDQAMSKSGLSLLERHSKYEVGRRTLIRSYSLAPILSSVETYQSQIANTFAIKHRKGIVGAQFIYVIMHMFSNGVCYFRAISWRKAPEPPQLRSHPNTPASSRWVGIFDRDLSVS